MMKAPYLRQLSATRSRASAMSIFPPDPNLVRAKRAAARNSSGLLECEVCMFVAQDAYLMALFGELCEVHHRNPLGDLGAGSTATRLEDLAILCSNCHRAIHQTRPMMTVDEFRDRFRRRQV